MIKILGTIIPDKKLGNRVIWNKDMKIKIERKWAMPSKWTFTIKPIQELLYED